MKLYTNPRSRAARVEIMLTELGVDCERVHIDLESKQNKQPDYLAVHPLGQLPALVDDDGRVLIESVAICMYLAEKYIDKGLAPTLNAPERGAYLQWCLYTLGTLEMAMVRQAQVNEGGESKSYGIPSLEEALRVVNDGLGDRVTLLESGFSCADVVLGSTVLWVEMFGMDVPQGEALKRYKTALMARPSFATNLGG